MSIDRELCPMCDSEDQVSRRAFLQTTGAGIALASGVSWPQVLNADDKQSQIAAAPETLVKELFQTLNDQQKNKVCFDWDYVSTDRGLLRTRVANNWKITEPSVISDFYTKSQQALIRKIFEGILNPDWVSRFDKQLHDDMGGYGVEQSLAIFGVPGSSKFEFVLTGRHTTLRCDGNSQDHVAMGGPVFYGHAASSFDEKPNHPGNVFWEQAVAANGVYAMLDSKQRKLAEVASSPSEEEVGFRSDSKFPGIPVTELSGDQREALGHVLAKLVEPFRGIDREEIMTCLKKQGGIEKLHLAFYTDEDVGNDKVWDNWRLEGPSFVWYFRGSPHVHVWANVADDASVVLNA